MIKKIFTRIKLFVASYFFFVCCFAPTMWRQVAEYYVYNFYIYIYICEIFATLQKKTERKKEEEVIRKRF